MLLVIQYDKKSLTSRESETSLIRIESSVISIDCKPPTHFISAEKEIPRESFETIFRMYGTVSIEMGLYCAFNNTPLKCTLKFQQNRGIQETERSSMDCFFLFKGNENVFLR